MFPNTPCVLLSIFLRIMFKLHAKKRLWKKFYAKIILTKIYLLVVNDL